MITILQGDCIEQMKTMPEKSVQCCVTSPPYWGLRSYLPNGVKLKDGVPQSVLDELKALGIYPVDHTSDSNHSTA